MGVASMTGFGRGVTTVDGITATVEITSVNRKQLDCQVMLPRNLGSLDARVQAALRTALTRGYVKVAVTVASETPAAAEAVPARWRRRVAAVRAAAAALGLPDDLTASALLRLDDADDPETRDAPPTPPGRLSGRRWRRPSPTCAPCGCAKGPPSAPICGNA